MQQQMYCICIRWSTKIERLFHFLCPENEKTRLPNFNFARSTAKFRRLEDRSPLEVEQVLSRQRFSCRSRRQRLYRLIDSLFSLQTDRTPRSRITSNGGIQQCESRLRFFICLSSSSLGSLLRRSSQNEFRFKGLQLQTHSCRCTPGLDIMDACCYFDYNVFKIFVTEISSEAGTLFIISI